MYNINTNSSPEKFAQQLIEVAINGEHEKVTTLNNFNDYEAAKLTRQALEKLIIGFDRSSKMYFKQYVKDIKRGIHNTQALILFKEMKECLEFYTKEYEEIDKVIEEYKSYLFFGLNFLKAWCGHDRRDD